MRLRKSMALTLERLENNKTQNDAQSTTTITPSTQGKKQTTETSDTLAPSHQSEGRLHCCQIIRRFTASSISRTNGESQEHRIITKSEGFGNGKNIKEHKQYTWPRFLKAREGFNWRHKSSEHFVTDADPGANASFKRLRCRIPSVAYCGTQNYARI